MSINMSINMSDNTNYPSMFWRWTVDPNPGPNPDSNKSNTKTKQTNHPKSWNSDNHYGQCGQSCPCCRARMGESFGACTVCLN